MSCEENVCCEDLKDRKGCGGTYNFYNCCKCGDSDYSSLPYVTGVFQDSSLLAATNTPLTPIIENGDSELISGNRFVAPESGIYNLSCSGAWGNAGAAGAHVMSAIAINNPDVSSITSGRLAEVRGFEVAMFPSVNVTVWLNEGDFLVYVLNSTVVQTTIRKYDSLTRFAFVRIR